MRRQCIHESEYANSTGNVCARAENENKRKQEIKRIDSFILTAFLLLFVRWLSSIWERNMAEQWENVHCTIILIATLQSIFKCTNDDMRFQRRYRRPTERLWTNYFGGSEHTRLLAYIRKRMRQANIRARDMNAYAIQGYLRRFGRFRFRVNKCQ